MYSKAEVTNSGEQNTLRMLIFNIALFVLIKAICCSATIFLLPSTKIDADLFSIKLSVTPQYVIH